MLLVCLKCAMPIVVPVRTTWLAPRLNITCKCGAEYAVMLELIKEPSEEKLAEIAKEQLRRIQTYICPNCNGNLDLNLTCPKCRKSEDHK